MKAKVLFFLVSFWFITQIQAQSVVALHSSNGVQFFSDGNPLQSAYTAAVDNDTIYLPGGSFAMPSKFEKKLRIIGAGHDPSTTSATFKTRLAGDLKLSEEASGFYLEGVKVSNIYFDTDEQVNDVTIKRCNIHNIYIDGNRTTPSHNCIFQQNIIHDANLSNLTNSYFFNNIIENHISNADNLNFMNNVFLYTDTYYSVFYHANSCILKNNIFLQEGNNFSAADSYSEHLTCSHNIICATTYDPSNTTYFGRYPILDSNYQMNRTDVLVNQSGDTFDYSHNYHLQPGAQANLGDDGTEIGIYGGYYPWKEGSIPSNPHISSKNISSDTNANGTIHIDINVRAQDR